MGLGKRVLQRARAILGRAGYSIYPNKDYLLDDQLSLLAGLPAPTIFDVGANEGKFTRSYRAAMPDSRIYCIEPIPHLARKLRENMPDVEVIEGALSETDGRSSFYLNEFEDTSSLLATAIEKIPQSYQAAMQPKHCLEVRTSRLDSLMELYSLDRIDILKMDIQGGEYAALKGARGSLSEKRISIIATEVFFEIYYSDQPRFGDIAALLAEFDYKLYRLYNISFSGRDGRPQWADAIFVSPLFSAEVINK